MFARPQKSVVRGPFRPAMAPAWFATVKNGAPIMRALLRFEVAPSWLKVPGLIWTTLRNS